MLMIVIAGFVLIEIFPFLFVLDWRFMENFMISSLHDHELTEPLNASVDTRQNLSRLASMQTQRLPSALISIAEQPNQR